MAINPCAAHRHPTLSKSTSREQLEAEINAAVADCIEIGLAVLIVHGIHCDDAERFYAQTVDRAPDALIEIDVAALWLPAAHRWGLAYHEAGHILCMHQPDHTEEDADDAVMHAVGIQIAYDTRWPGKGLQYVAKAASRGWRSRRKARR